MVLLLLLLVLVVLVLVVDEDAIGPKELKWALLLMRDSTEIWIPL